ncbi:TrmO family methyltransferase domain-containing protein [Tropicimonas aquimaris]|uniref:TrmO family methyltransferase n=1 Tax=Tropicimonas aquimaris TaxID=914152 RepID=A0ABW3IT93_9RHOB
MSDRDDYTSEIRPGERVLDRNPASADDARICFIGEIRTPWGPQDCPRNIGSARQSGQGARIELIEGMGEGLEGLAPGQPLVVLYWMDRARRDLILQAPRHTEAPRGTFALRSPNRPNPVAMSVVLIVSIDARAGVIEIDALDCFDRTPVVDLKPWHASIDSPAELPSGRNP